MIDSAAAIGFKLFIWTFRIATVSAVLFAIFAIINFVMQFIILGVNGNLLTDLLAFFQIWLPFNFSTIIVWFTTFVSLYVGYQFLVLANNLLLRVIGDN